MKLVPYNKKDIEVGYRKTKHYELLLEFAESDMECALVENWNGKSATIKAANLNRSAKRFKMNHIRAIVRKGKIYLIKEL